MTLFSWRWVRSASRASFDCGPRMGRTEVKLPSSGVYNPRVRVQPPTQQTITTKRKNLSDVLARGAGRASDKVMNASVQY